MSTSEHFPTEIEGLPEARRSELVELNDGDQFDLRITPVAKRLGKATVRMLAYNGSIPGPTLKVPEGSEIVVNVMLFLVMVDVGVVQTPMFHETPGRFAWLLPSYGPSRVMYDGAFSEAFWEALVIGVGWLAALSAAVYVVLRRAVGQHV